MGFERTKETIVRIAKEYGVKVRKVIIFGSFARGEEREDSDLDIYVVVDRYVPEFHDKLYTVLPKLLNREVDVIVMPETLFVTLSKEPGTFEFHVKQHGVSI